MPERIQLSRRKGWRMPANTVKVSRPGKFGNPFTEVSLISAGYSLSKEGAQAYNVQCFRLWLEGSEQHWMGAESDKARATLLAALPELRGKNLACWCKLGTPCHADVLLEMANG